MDKTGTKYDNILTEAELVTRGIQEDAMRAAAFGAVVSHLLQLSSEEAGSGIRHSGKSDLVTEKRDSKKKTGPGAWLSELVEEEFFLSPKSMSEILQELENRSHHLRAADLTSQLKGQCHKKILRRTKRVEVGGAKEVLHWTNW